MELEPMFLGCSASQSESSYNHSSSASELDDDDDIVDLQQVAAAANANPSTPSPPLSLVANSEMSAATSNSSCQPTLNHQHNNEPQSPQGESANATTNQASGQATDCAGSGKSKKLFPQKLWELIHDPKYNFCLRWSDDGQLVYLNRDVFEESYLRKPDNQFHTQKAISFVRQMNMYGFRKVDDSYYENPNFKRNAHHKIKEMVRKNTKDDQTCNGELRGATSLLGNSSNPSLLFRASARSHQNHGSQQRGATSLLEPQQHHNQHQQQQQQQAPHHNNHMLLPPNALALLAQAPPGPMGDLVNLLIQTYGTNQQQLLLNLSPAELELINNYIGTQIISNLSASQVPVAAAAAAAFPLPVPPAAPTQTSNGFPSPFADQSISNAHNQALDLHYQNQLVDRNEESPSPSLDGFSNNTATAGAAIGNMTNNQAHLSNWNQIHNHQLSSSAQQNQLDTRVPNREFPSNKRKANRSTRSYKRSVDSILDLNDNYNKFPVSKTKPESEQSSLQLNICAENRHIEPLSPMTQTPPISSPTINKQAESLILNAALTNSLILDEEAVRQAAKMTEKFAKTLMETAQLIAKHSSSCSNNNGVYIPTFNNGHGNNKQSPPAINSSHLMAALTLLPSILSNLLE